MNQILDQQTSQIVALIFSHLTVSGTAVWLIQKAKSIPWLVAHMQKFQRMWAIVASFLASAGIHYTWNSAEHTLVITGLTLTGVLTFLWHWLNQFVLQEMVYRGMAKS